jgi:hypothetical protein|tara:strand:+ start:252 stop:656 length:405 start_codon:yes stop_codon:yes gene_type:complete
MPDEVLTIKLTAREVELLMNCIGTNIETIKRRHNPMDGMVAELIEELFELETDLREGVNRQGDGWDVPDDPDLEGHTFTIAEDDMIQRGMDARQQAKLNSRAAERRNFNLKRQDSRLSRTQTHDVWDANDPKNW